MKKTKGKHIAIVTGVAAVVVLGIAVWVGWPSLRFWYLFKPLGVNAQGYQEYRHRATGIVMVSLPGGKFWMGAQKTNPNGQNYDPKFGDGVGPVHEVVVSHFLLGNCEVTCGQWKAVMGTDSANTDLPVSEVSWDDSMEFCEKTGLTLPTEAQWEYACRAPGTSSPPARPADPPTPSWKRRPEPMGSRPPNGFGLNHMSGNLFEWCLDEHDDQFYERPESGGLDPVLRKSPSGYHPMRGGAYLMDPEYCTCSIREATGATDSSSDCGFRVAYPLP